MTRTKLFEERKKEWVPDASYDLDGDGFVGGHDYVIARRFDNGCKNYLTKEEREEAFEALRNVSWIVIYLHFYRDTKKTSSGTVKPAEEQEEGHSD
jgi:hypothetical protein